MDDYALSTRMNTQFQPSIPTSGSGMLGSHPTPRKMKGGNRSNGQYGVIQGYQTGYPHELVSIQAATVLQEQLRKVSISSSRYSKDM